MCFLILILISILINYLLLILNSIKLFLLICNINWIDLFHFIIISYSIIIIFILIVI